MFCSNSYEYVVNLETNAASYFSRAGQSKRMVNTPEDKRKRSGKQRQLFSTPEKSDWNVSPPATVSEQQWDDSFRLLPIDHESDEPSSTDHLYCHSSSSDCYPNGIATGVLLHDELHHSMPVHIKECDNCDIKMKGIERMQLKDAIDSLSRDMKDICSVNCPSVLRETSVSSLAVEDLVKNCVVEMSQR